MFTPLKVTHLFALCCFRLNLLLFNYLSLPISIFNSFWRFIYFFILSVHINFHLHLFFVFWLPFPGVRAFLKDLPLDLFAFIKRFHSFELGHSFKPSSSLSTPSPTLLNILIPSNLTIYLKKNFHSRRISNVLTPLRRYHPCETFLLTLNFPIHALRKCSGSL